MTDYEVLARLTQDELIQQVQELESQRWPSTDTSVRRLSDRELATVIDALQIAREKIKANGGSGDDCQSALDQLYDGMAPETNGLTYMLGQHAALIDPTEPGWLTRLDDATDVNGHLSRAVDHLEQALALLRGMNDRARTDARYSDEIELAVQIAQLTRDQRSIAEHITA